MTTDTTTQNLLFLLAAAPLGLGCIIVSDDTDDTAGDTGNQTSGQPTATDTGSGSSPVTDEGTGSGGSGADSTSRGESSTAGDTTAGGSGACADYAALIMECQPEYAEGAEEYCQDSVSYYEMTNAPCGAAYEDYIACLSALTCAEFMSDAPCPDELAAFMAACPTGE